VIVEEESLSLEDGTEESPTNKNSFFETKEEAQKMLGESVGEVDMRAFIKDM
jgi:hypothetical protein